MFEIFGALFGTAWLSAKFHSDKNKTNKARLEYETNKIQRKEFFEKYAIDMYEWNRLTHWFDIRNSDLRHTYYEKIILLKEELSPVIGIEPTDAMIYWGIIAKQGKIPPELEFSGTGFSNLLSYRTVHQFDDYFYDYTPEERNWFRLKFLKWYDKTLCENGMEYKLVCERENDDLGCGEQFNIIGNIEDLSYKHDPFRIVAYWEPLH